MRNPVTHMPRSVPCMLATVLATAGGYTQQEPPPEPEPPPLAPGMYRIIDGIIRQFDANDDAQLTAEEIKQVTAHVEARFGQRGVRILERHLDAADSNRDHILTETEWNALGEHLGIVTEVVIETATVTMSDGVRLATEICRPADGNPVPVLLTRTPYGRRFDGVPGMARNGYAVVRQDMRGRFDSGGDNLPFIGCGWARYTDGVDTVEWLLKQPWCNGSIGTVGGSASGITQNLLAGAAPKGLRCQYISVAAASLYHHAAYVGGALRWSQVEKWLTGNEFSPDALELYQSHPNYDDFWHDLDSMRRHERMTVPAIHVGGWFDTFSLGTVESFVGRQYNGGPGARGTQKLVMGPWAHGGYKNDGVVGELQFANSRMPQPYSAANWFGIFLKKTGDDPALIPPVAYDVMGETENPDAPGNEWRFAPEWPIGNTPTPFFLHDNGGLAPEPAENPALADYTFDPRNPCPTVGGCNLTIENGPMDQQRVEQRPDVITFTTTPLDKPLEITGHIQALLFVTSSAMDTDLSVRVCDVYPDGRSFMMAEGMLRLRFRNGLDTPRPLTPGEITPVTVDCWPTSFILNRGHQLRIGITSSNFPRFDVNPGTGRPYRQEDPVVPQTNVVHIGPRTPSRIILPVPLRPSRAP